MRPKEVKILFYKPNAGIGIYRDSIHAWAWFGMHDALGS